MKIQLTLKPSYGRILAYPNCPASTTFARMLHAKTLTRENLGHIKALGFDIETNAGVSIDQVQ